MSDGKPIYKSYKIRATVLTTDRIVSVNILDINPDIASCHGETFDEFVTGFHDMIYSYIADGGRTR